MLIFSSIVAGLINIDAPASSIEGGGIRNFAVFDTFGQVQGDAAVLFTHATLWAMENVIIVGASR